MNDPTVFENPCVFCKKRIATRLCDYVLEYPSTIFVRDFKEFQRINACRHETCDLPICEECATKMNPNVDLCPHHHEVYKQAELPQELKRERIKQRVKMYSE